MTRSITSLSGLTITGSDSTIKGLAINRFSGIGGFGIYVRGAGATGNHIVGNFIGTNSSGTQVLANYDGVRIEEAPGNTVGGTETGARNVISGNTYYGINIFGAGATGNVIFGNGGDGVTVLSGAGNRILSNLIYSNADLGINLWGGTEGAAGVTNNDGGDYDTGANNLQNFPVISYAAQNSDGSTTINGTLNSSPRQWDYTIQIFVAESDSSGYGEGQKFLGSTGTLITNPASGDYAFSLTVPAGLRGQSVSATATNAATGDTSEFSQIKVVN